MLDSEFTTSRRWRTFADGVAVALGVNVWVSLVVLPGFFVGAFRTPGFIALSLIPVVTLAFGLWRRSETILLFAFPSALLLPAAADHSIFAATVYGPGRFALVGAGLVAYLFGASYFTTFHEPERPRQTRPLASAKKPLAERWRRRFRVYRMLTAVSVVFPLVLLYAVNFHEENQALLVTNFPGRAGAMTAVLALGAAGVWVLLYWVFFLGILHPHRTGDKDLTRELAMLRREGQSGKPRIGFFIGVIAAVVLMIILFVLKG